MQISRFVLALLAASVLATGCAKQRAPATKAVEAIEHSLAEVRDDAAKYAPDGLKGVESQLARLKTSLDANHVGAGVGAVARTQRPDVMAFRHLGQIVEQIVQIGCLASFHGSTVDRFLVGRSRTAPRGRLSRRGQGRRKCMTP
jgi:hypothetical protein